MKVKKIKNQNLTDFIISHYGSLEYISIFLKDNNITDILSFEYAPIGTVYIVNTNINKVLTNYKSKDYIVATGSTVPGDYNDDFSDDFLT